MIGVFVRIVEEELLFSCLLYGLRNKLQTTQFVDGVKKMLGILAFLLVDACPSINRFHSFFSHPKTHPDYFNIFWQAKLLSRTVQYIWKWRWWLPQACELVSLTLRLERHDLARKIRLQKVMGSRLKVNRPKLTFILKKD